MEASRRTPLCAKTLLFVSLIAGCSGSPPDQADASAEELATQGSDDASLPEKEGELDASAASRDSAVGLPDKPTQGDAPAGYCPGYAPKPDDRPCWDRQEGVWCYRCYSPLEVRATCSGVADGPSISPATCASDSDCARRGTVCEPGHPYADAQGCRAPACDEGASCPEGTICDPDAPSANPAILKLNASGTPTPGCRILRCDEPGAMSCVAPSLCAPARSSHPLGCALPACGMNGACPAGSACMGTTCMPPRCDAPGGAACAAGTRCEAGQGCIAVHCSQPGGAICAAGKRCDPAQTGTGCVDLACDEPDALPCAQGTFCGELPGRRPACLECLTNADCGCGSCIRGLCFNRPGYCEPGCA